MAGDLGQISILARREIEARVMGPMIRAFANQLGNERTLEIVNLVVQSFALESGVLLAKQMGANRIGDFAKGLNAWKANDALEYDVIELTDDTFSFDVKRCRYVDLYRELGMADLGVLFSCNRDFNFIEGFNPRMRLVRTKTIMEGHDLCDFRITLRES
jgi:hypothetical protein